MKVSEFYDVTFNILAIKINTAFHIIFHMLQNVWFPSWLRYYAVSVPEVLYN